MFCTIRYFLLKVMTPSGKGMYPKSLHIMIVSGGSPAKNPRLILSCANTTAGGMWSSLKLMSEVAVMFSLFAPDSFSSDTLSLGSHVFRKIVWICWVTAFIRIKISVRRKFQFLVQLSQIFKDVCRICARKCRRLCHSQHYATVSTVPQSALCHSQRCATVSAVPQSALCHSQHRHSLHNVIG